MLIVAGLIAGVGFLAMLITSVFHMRAMNRLAGIAAALPMGGAFIPGAAEALGEMEEKLVTMAPGGNPGTRLLSAIERLEKRVFELEHTSHTAEAGAGSSGPQGGGRVIEAELAAGEGQEAASLASGEPSEGQDQVSMLLGKAQALLSLGQAEEAVACFDAVLRLEPHHAEALVKKGTALEKLKRLDEAIECYDRAIHANQSMTLAYLYKGGLFNRMERYDEALACYEQALKTQGKGAS